MLLAKKEDWRGVRLTNQIRAEEGIAIPQQQDSKYKVEYNCPT
jgi:hypothetical protein